MRARRILYERGLVAFVCMSLMVTSFTSRAAAQSPNKAKISLTIGQPGIWSLAQAHYLLATMRDVDKAIPTTALSLNPNDTNGFRFDVLRQVFGAEGGFNGVAGAQNSVEMERFRQDVTRRQGARGRLDEVLETRQVVVTQLARINRRLAEAQVEEDDLNALPEKDRPADFKTQLQKVQAHIKDLSGGQAKLQAQKEGLDAQIESLEKDTNSTVTPPTLNGVFGATLPTGPAGAGSNPPSLPNDIADVIGKILANPPNAKLNASAMLDNYIQLQYEVIAKQLTLLRDEVGPDQRLVFLELPSSVYTVPGKSDDYLVEVNWRIAEYYGRDPNLSLAGQSLLEGARDRSEKTSVPITLELIDKLEAFGGPKARYLEFATGKTDPEIEILWHIRKLLYEKGSLRALSASQERPESETRQEEEERKIEEKRRQEEERALDRQVVAAIANYNQLLMARTGSRGADQQAVKDLARTMSDDYEVFVQNPALSRMKWSGVEPSNNDFRTVDIIPRQSALNVNAANASSTGLNLSAAFQWLTGIGAKVSYQRQRQVYEQFINQEIFASGSGKGVNNFSWTFGPLPGTKCVTPGVKTTYAVLVIPKDALVLKLHGAGSGYRKKESPFDAPIDLGRGKFRIVVPDEQTEGFWLNAISYTPVVQGERLTAILTGDYFSPQIGILVNGVPLTRVVSIGNSSIGAGTGVQGQFEYVSSNEIVMAISMGDGYLGTPIVTLVTPEKTSTINYFRDLRINFGSRRQSLAEASKQEPMFLHRLELSEARVRPGNNQDSRLQIYGDGFRRTGEVSINGVEIDGSNIRMLSTGRYEVRLTKKTIKDISEASGDPAHTRRDSILWKIRYRQHTKQGYEYAPIFDYQRPIISDYDIVSFSRDPKTGVGQLVLKISIPDQPTNVAATFESGGAQPRSVDSITNDGHGQYRITISLNKDQVSLTLTVTADGRPERVFDDIGLPEAPTIDKVANLGTDKEEGPADTEHDVKITGSHLKRVVHVMFNTTPGQVIQGDSDNVLLVRTPKMEGPTRVLLRTDLTLNGRPITNINDIGTANKAKYLFKKTETAAAEPSESKPKKAPTPKPKAKATK